jgi:hypothetical protein
MKAFATFALLLAGTAASLQGNPNPDCAGEQRPMMRCPEGYHAVYECVCGLPAEPCHWVGHCEKN